MHLTVFQLLQVGKVAPIGSPWGALYDVDIYLTQASDKMIQFFNENLFINERYGYKQTAY